MQTEDVRHDKKAVAKDKLLEIKKARKITHDNQIGLSTKTINHYHTFLHSVLLLAQREGILNANPADGASPPKVARKEAEYFEIECILAIRKALLAEPLKYRITIYLLADTGVRYGELFGLR